MMWKMYRVISEFVKNTFVFTVFGFIFLFLLVPLSLSCYLWRYVLIRSSIDQILSLSDTYFLLLDQIGPKNPEAPRGIITISVTVKGILNLVDFKGNCMNFLTDTKENYPYRRLRQYIVKSGGYYFYKWDTHFNVDHHIRQYDAKVPITRENLNNYVITKTQQPFPNAQSPWTVDLIPNFNGENKTVVLWKLHHSLGDGISIVRLMMNRVFQGGNLANDLKKLSSNNSQLPPIPSSTISKLKCILSPINIYRRIICWPRIYLQKFQSSPQPTSGPDNHNSNTFMDTTTQIPMTSFKRLKVNQNIPTTVSIFTAIAYSLIKNVSLRYDSLLFGYMFPLPGHSEDEFQNYFGFTYFKLNLSSLRSRGVKSVESVLHHITEELDGIKKHASPLEPLLWNLLVPLPVGILKYILPPKPLGITVSNMMGPSDQTNLWTPANPIEDIRFWIQSINPFPTITFNCISYNGEIHVNCMGSTHCIQEEGSEGGKRIVKDIEEAFFCLFNRTKTHANLSSSYDIETSHNIQ